MDIFDNLKLIGKTVCIANIGGFRPESNDYNWFGGNFLSNESTLWPEDNGTKLIPILQLYVPDIKDGLNLFGDHILVQIFINLDRLPSDISKSGNGWELVFHKDINDLFKVETPSTANVLKPFPIKWTSNTQPDYPCWEESWAYCDMTEINESEELSDRFFDEFAAYSRTKIGGYASYIQSPISNDYEFILQISSEQKPGLMIGDNGNFYIYKSRTDNEWYLYWDCY